MRILAIDCATDACSVALLDNGAVLAAAHEIISRGHAERLVPMIAALPDCGRAQRILVSLGPGSFTGTRIGVAAARALGLAWGAEVLGYPTLALIAAMARRSACIPVSVAMAGGHGEFYVQNFGPDGSPQDDIVSLVPPAAASHARHDLVAGSRADQLVALRGYGQAMGLLPDARAALSLPQSLLTPALAPLYGRPPDAKIAAATAAGKGADTAAVQFTAP